MIEAAIFSKQAPRTRKDTFILGYFPDPYPDELFYSLCARFSEVMQYPGSNVALSELFGLISTGKLASLPTELDRVVAALPPLTTYTVQHLIAAHTLFPYYAPFLPAERASRLYQTMIHDKSRVNPFSLTGITRHGIRLGQCLRFCPVCVEEDRRSFGQCYWHRLHQVTGVEVCPVHQVFLQNSTAHLYNKSHPHQITSAERAIQAAQLQVLDPDNSLHQALLEIASDTAWLLDHPNLIPAYEGLHQRYKALLYEQGMATYYGKIQTRQVIACFLKHYPPELLALLSSQFAESSHTNWLFYLLRRSPKGQPPIRHLLTMHFLGCTAERFFALPSEPAPFGAGPWPCLNPTCKSYRQPIIRAFQLTHNEEGRPRGSFACECGFEYSRLGPDQSTDDQLQKNWVKAYGPVWEAALRSGWQNPTLPLTRLAQQLGVYRATVINYAANLGLTFPRPGTTALLDDKVQGITRKHKIKTIEQLTEQRKRYRKACLSWRQAHPEGNRTTLAEKMYKEYRWLRLNDGKWFEEHFPRQMPKKGGRRGVQDSSNYWMQRDNQLAKEVLAAAQNMRTAPGRPIRITRTALSDAISRVGAFNNQLAKLPLTASVLSKVVETPEMAGVRRIWWEIECFRHAHTLPTRRQLIRKAGVNFLITHPTIKQAIDAGLELLYSLDANKTEG